MATQGKAVATAEAKPHGEQAFLRFSIFQRLEHILLIASFTTLAVTGLVQKFAGNPVAEWTIGALGGIETVRTIHHIAAIIFVLEGIYHFIVLAHKVFVQRVEMSMLPGLRDLTDAIDAVRYNLGLTAERPRLPRYNFAEKMEYWAMIWGFALMAFTGFLLWNPVFVTRFLPGQVIPAAKVAHGAEAILAVLAILVWHVYNVHIKTFNKSMFNGRLTRHQMEEEHGEELARLEAGQQRRRLDGEALRRRERIFLPVAALGAIVLLLGLWWFVTFETTAIATVPPQTAVPAFVPLTPTPAPTPVAEGNRALGAPMPHPVEGMEGCLTCHGAAGMAPQPADHVGRPLESCLICHKPGPAGPAAAIPHAVVGREQCDLCHGQAGSLRPLPEDHAGRTVQTCIVCHKPVAPAEVSEAGMPRAIPHSISEAIYADCSTCHGSGGMRPVPANHAAFAADSCTACHQPPPPAVTPEGAPTPEAGAAAGGPRPIPHSISAAVYADCDTCHGPGGVQPSPENHAAFAAGSCTGCHLPAQE